MDEEQQSNPEKSEEIMADIGPKLCRQIDFYFSEFNLNTDGYLRRLLQSSQNGSIPMKQLMEFKSVRILAIKMKASDLLEILENFPFENVLFSKETLSFSLKKCFIFDKLFMKRNHELIVYVKKLPLKISLLDLMDWATVKYGKCNIKPIKRDNGKYIRSAFIVFSDQDSVSKMLNERDEENGIDFEDRGKTKALPYNDYPRQKNWHRRQSKQKKLLDDLEKLAINQETGEKMEIDEAEKEKRSERKIAMYARRTIWLHDVSDDEMIDRKSLKQVLLNIGILYLYTVGHSKKKIKTDSDNSVSGTTGKNYYLLFKNRTLLNRFYEIVKNSGDLSPLAFTENNDDNNNNEIKQDENITKEKLNKLFNMKTISLIDIGEYPSEFIPYVKRCKAFFKKKNNL